MEKYFISDLITIAILGLVGLRRIFCRGRMTLMFDLENKIWKKKHWHWNTIPNIINWLCAAAITLASNSNKNKSQG